MADKIKCPVCGESNPSEFEFCQYCQSRLQPLTGALKGADAPITPGAAPTKKTTADLEPILPQWLRDARSSARDASEGDLPQTLQPTKTPTPTPSHPSDAPQDLLAGLRSQTEDDEEETPDWLANITGGAPSSKKLKEESSDVRWVELGGAKDSASESDVPSWMQGLAPLELQPDKKDDLTDWMQEASGAPQQPAADAPDWLRQMSADNSGSLFDDSANTFTPADSSDAPDWLNSLSTQSNAAPAPSSDAPDWLKSLDAADSGPQNNDTLFGSAAPAASDAPDWLNSLGAKSDTAPAASDAPDWLNSLGAKSDTAPAASDTPDWLNSLGAKNDAAPVASDTPDWLRSLDAADSGSQNNDTLFGSAAPAASESPDWLSSLGSHDNVAPAPSSDTPDWLSSLGAADSGTQSNAAPAADTPDWMSSLGAQSNAASAPSSDIPDWLSSLGAADSSAQSSAAPAADTPDWMSSLGAQSNAVSAPSSDTPDWLSSLESADSSTQGSVAPAPDTPDWMRGLDAGTPSAPMAAPTPPAGDDWLTGIQSGGSQSAQSDQLSEADMPSWLSDAPAPASPAAEPKAEDATLGDVPSWLKAAAPQSSIFDDLPAAQPAAPIDSSNRSDWSNTFKSLDPALPVQTPSDSSLGGSSDALFTDMPDWLSGSAETPAPSPATETPMEGEIEASQLPSWVQAMRPVDTGVAQTSSSSDETLEVEARGALAGLQGVLPAAPDYAPTSKPKAYSLKLQATDEQLSQATLLEQILAAETSPVPIASFSTLRASRGLRWSLALIFFAMTFAILFLRTEIFSLPVGVPFEVDGAVQVAAAIPNGAPVLVAFDYEPARVAEMEAAAVPMFDQMALRSPRFTFIATNENSSILVDRFMTTGLMAVHRTNGLQYLNLGYLPGGQMGIRAFVQNPSETARFDVAFAPAWDSTQLQGVTSVSQFAAFILVTDSADSARAWIEQMEAMQVSIPVAVISSAQAAPMIQPYYASGQIKGLVGGLQAGATYEQNNGGRPGTARAYWDAYSIGMLIAMALILGGGLLNLFLGSRDRAAAGEVK